MTHYKRENSVSVQELQILSDSIKRFAISVDGKAYTTNNKTTIDITIKQPLPPPPSPTPIESASPDHNTDTHTFSIKMPNPIPLTHVMSTAKDNFPEAYEMQAEIGRGGFSTVYKCRNKVTDQICAVKVSPYTHLTFIIRSI